MLKTLHTLLILVWITPSSLISQSRELLVLGTVHTNAVVNADSIYNFFESYQPQLILLETGPASFDADFNLLASGGESNERLAVQKYLKHYPGVAIRPFDMDGRVDVMYGRNGVLAREQRLYLAIRKLYKKGKLNEPHADLFSSFEQLRFEIYANRDLGLIAMNAPENQKRIKKRETIVTTGFLEIARSYAELEKFVAQKEADNHYLKTVERGMVEHILATLKSVQRKRVLVVVGNTHKAALEDLLLASQEVDFELLKMDR